MKIFNKHFSYAVVLAALVAPNVSLANDAGTLAQRCAEDSLAPDQALGRIGWVARCIAENGGTFQGYTKKDITGMKMEFDANDNVVPRSRPQYPTFVLDKTTTWAAPIDPAAPCAVPAGYVPLALCTSSCYTPEQQLLYKQGY